MKIVNAANDRHAITMKKLGELCGADEVRYRDHGKAEAYFIVKNNSTFVISIQGNHFDGGYLGGVDEVEDTTPNPDS